MYALASEHAAHGVPVPVGEPGIVDILLWGVLPYVTILILIGGTIWRYRTDQFSWTTRSSQIYESKMLRLGSPLFHYGLAAVFMGHVGGLVVPKMLTDYVVDDHTYHIVALVGGSAAALATIAGLALLLWRRRNNAQVFTATTANDKFMYFVLVAVILAGTAATLFSAINPSAGERARSGVQLPHLHRGMVPFHLLLPPGGGTDGQRAAILQDSYYCGHGAVHHLAVHSPGARADYAAALPVPPVHHLPFPRWGACGRTPWLGSDRYS